MMMKYLRDMKDYWKMGASVKKWQDRTLFRAVEIETVNRCNGKCSFCPVNANQPQRPYAKMSPEFLRNIIDQLEEIGFKGKICLFSNNEPFLDENIIEYMKYTRKHLKDAYTYIYTNGSILTIEQLKEALRG